MYERQTFLKLSEEHTIFFKYAVHGGKKTMLDSAYALKASAPHEKQLPVKSH